MPGPGVSSTTGASAASMTATRTAGVDMAVGEVRMPVAAGVELVSRVVQVHQVDASGDGPDALDDPDQVLAARPGMAGVQAETGLPRKSPTASPQPLDLTRACEPSRDRPRRCSR